MGRLKEVPGAVRLVSGKQEPAFRLVYDNNPFVYPNKALFWIMSPVLPFGCGGVGVCEPNTYLQIVLLVIMVVEEKGI